MISITSEWNETSGRKNTIYTYRELWGAKSLMNGKDYAIADFGTFEVSGSRVLHSSFAGDIDYPSNADEQHSEFIDDLSRLKRGECEYFN